MANIIKDIESIIDVLKASISELETIKGTLEGKELSRRDIEHLDGYLMNVIDDTFNMTGSLDDFIWAASIPGGYKLEYTHKVYKIGDRTLECNEKLIIKLEA